MQITRQADYALRTIMHLAKLPPNERVSTRTISEREHIPASFLAKIVAQLANAGLVRTSRGTTGGIQLARDASEINVLSVIEAIDGPIHLNHCLDPKVTCFFGSTCTMHRLLGKVQSDLVETLSGVNVKDLVNPTWQPGW